jgi:hypothetical protein
MGLFDDISVPKSYLRNILSKFQERMLEKDHRFQTKSLGSLMSQFKVFRQRLYEQDRDFGHWNIKRFSGDVQFYDFINDESGNSYEIVFEFAFIKGKLDKKALLKWEVFETIEEKKETEKMWNIEQQIFSSYRKTFKYQFFLKLETLFAKLSSWARLKHQIPLKIRKSAYKKSGRLKLDPQALDLYNDT